VDVVALIGRILYGLLYVGSGMGHLTQLDAMAGYAESRGVKPGKPLTAISGVLIIAGGLGVILGVWADLAALGLAVFSFLAAVLMHPFWRFEGMERMQEMVQFNKDLALSGAGLVLFVYFTSGPGLTLTGPLF
jgi:uncharacterized membrane protein YphA (DoxX/SURF4 family)